MNLHTLKLKLTNFLNADLRNKFKKIKIYPKFFHRNGIKSLYPKFIFTIIFIRNVIIKYMFNYNQIFNIKINNPSEKINYLASTPSSGGTFMRLMIKSYFEMFFSLGNGIPKYESVYNKWMLSASPILSDNMQNAIMINERSDIPENLGIDYNSILSPSEFKKIKVVFGRHPLSMSDLYKSENFRAVVILRKPEDQILSVYTRRQNKNQETNNIINKERVSNLVNSYKKYIKYWIDFSKENKDQCIFIKNEDLINETYKTLERTLKFFNYDINDELVKKAADYNSVEFSNKIISGIKKRTTLRFTDKSAKDEQKKILGSYLQEIIKENHLDKLYENIK